MLIGKGDADDGTPIITLGLEEGNIERLKRGEPIYKNLAEVCGVPVRIVIHYGKDQAALLADLGATDMVALDTSRLKGN